MTPLVTLLLLLPKFSHSFPSSFLIPYISSSLHAIPKIFIDGEAGTTGLQVRAKLSSRSDIEIISPPSDLRKDPETRRKYLNDADCAILCLPDAASIEAANWLDLDGNTKTVLIDASTAFRVDPAWDYGFPELSEENRNSIKRSKRISNPGCYPTGFIGLTRPLVEAGLIEEKTGLTVNAISGYSGGGKQLMQLYESQEEDCEPWGSYGFALNHKHLNEMAMYSKLNRKPIFQPAVAAFVQGMVVSIPIFYDQLSKGAKGKECHEALTEYYKDSEVVTVMPFGSDEFLERGAFLRPDTLANTNRMELFVFANDETEQCVLSARLDNLGKGASGAAVQNLNLALGLEEFSGLF